MPCAPSPNGWASPARRSPPLATRATIWACSPTPGADTPWKNASENVLARVPLHAPANTDDGVAQVLEDLLARGEIGG